MAKRVNVQMLCTVAIAIRVVVTVLCTYIDQEASDTYRDVTEMLQGYYRHVARMLGKALCYVRRVRGQGRLGLLGLF
jgi:hypothetical protein